ncbi:hypothetical protein D3C84_378880 [compost metagenome]
MLAGGQPEYQAGEEHLQAEGETHCSQRDTTAIIRTECGQSQDTEDTEQGDHGDSIR